jgi:effector-binding domain-containing protein
MASAAAGNQQVVVDDETREGCSTGIEFETFTGIKVKGRDQPISVHKPVKEAKAQNRGAQVEEQKLFIGRQKEIAEIEKRIEEVVHGSGRYLCVVGRGGLGKSALVSKTLSLCSEHKLKTIIIESPEFERNSVSTAGS